MAIDKLTTLLIDEGCAVSKPAMLKLQALIQQEITKARIDEVQNFQMHLKNYGNVMPMALGEYTTTRLQKLEGDSK